jgi:hypothetical protein
VDLYIGTNVPGKYTVSESFSHWCVIKYQIIILEFVHNQNYNIIKLQVSKARFCVCLQIKSGRGEKTYLVGAMAELASHLVQQNPAFGKL